MIKNFLEFSFTQSSTQVIAKNYLDVNEGLQIARAFH